MDTADPKRGRAIRVVRQRRESLIADAGTMALEVSSVLPGVGKFADEVRKLKADYVEREFLEAAVVDAAVAAREYQHASLRTHDSDLMFAPTTEVVTIDILSGRARGGWLANEHQAAESWRHVYDDLFAARAAFRRECPASAELPTAARRAVRQIGGAALRLLQCADSLRALWRQVGVYAFSGDPAQHIAALRVDMEPLYTALGDAVATISRCAATLEAFARREAPELWAEAWPEPPTQASEEQRRRRALNELADIARAVLSDGFSLDWLLHSPLGGRLEGIDLRTIRDCPDFDFVEPHRMNGWLSLGNSLEGAVERFVHRAALKRESVDEDVWGVAETIETALKRASHGAHEVSSRVQILPGAIADDHTRLEREIGGAKAAFRNELAKALAGIGAIGSLSQRR